MCVCTITPRGAADYRAAAQESTRGVEVIVQSHNNRASGRFWCRAPQDRRAAWRLLCNRTITECAGAVLVQGAPGSTYGVEVIVQSHNNRASGRFWCRSPQDRRAAWRLLCSRTITEMCRASLVQQSPRIDAVSRLLCNCTIIEWAGASLVQVARGIDAGRAIIVQPHNN